ncbi:hypothetical protein K438DRAFT_1959150 [Mycena galopus ATCC 62051]|nr:hypothetical protein K438DRAFT_1959150 [Mycena galopus ATCC 62051]
MRRAAGEMRREREPPHSPHNFPHISPSIPSSILSYHPPLIHDCFHLSSDPASHLITHPASISSYLSTSFILSSLPHLPIFVTYVPSFNYSTLTSLPPSSFILLSSFVLHVSISPSSPHSFPPFASRSSVYLASSSLASRPRSSLPPRPALSLRPTFVSLSASRPLLFLSLPLRVASPALLPPFLHFLFDIVPSFSHLASSSPFFLFSLVVVLSCTPGFWVSSRGRLPIVSITRRLPSVPFTRPRCQHPASHLRWHLLPRAASLLLSLSIFILSLFPCYRRLIARLVPTKITRVG